MDSRADSLRYFQLPAPAFAIRPGARILKRGRNGQRRENQRGRFQAGISRGGRQTGRRRRGGCISPERGRLPVRPGGWCQSLYLQAGGSREGLLERGGGLLQLSLIHISEPTRR